MHPSWLYRYLPPHRLWLVPLIGGIAWFLTLSILLIFWLAQGRPRYPYQIDPYIAFISDIGAHLDMKPVFIVGGSITAVSYAGTIFVVNHAHHSPEMYGPQESRTKRAFSWIAIAGSVVAGLSFILLTFFDTDRFHSLHAPLLLCAFLGIAVSAICTAAVYGYEMFNRAAETKALRKHCIINLSAVVVIIAATVAFLTCLHRHIFIVEGVLEWVISFLGAGYIWSFIGIVSFPERPEVDDGERQPLLSDED